MKPGSDDHPASKMEPSGPSIRINKFFTQQGICSRREADRWIEEKRIAINGQIAVLGDQVRPGDIVTRDGKTIPWGNRPVYLKYHKPVGITCTTERDVQGNIIDAIGYPERIFPIGRLDKDSSGLILLTNDGDIVNRILRAENKHEKEYVVQVDRSFDDMFLKRMREGVVVLGLPTRPCTVHRTGPRVFHILLTEGRNRQIRRMCLALGYRVLTLQRIRIMHILLNDLPAGQWKSLDDLEREELLRALALRTGAKSV